MQALQESIKDFYDLPRSKKITILRQVKIWLESSTSKKTMEIEKLNTISSRVYAYILLGGDIKSLYIKHN